MAAKDAAGGVMSAAELKPLLRQARRRPLSCAIGMTKEKHGLILLDRRKKPRKVMAELRRQAAAAGLELVPASIRFGRASVDGASDSAMVTFTVNKPAPGPTRMALLEQVRPAGFQRCEIVVDEALESETDDGEDEAEGDSGAEADEEAPGAVEGGTAPAPGIAAPSGGATLIAAADGGGNAAAPAVSGTLGAAGPGERNTTPSPFDPTARDTVMPANGAARQASAEPHVASGAVAPDAAALRTRMTPLVSRTADAIKSGQPKAEALRTAANTAYAALTSGDLAAAGEATDALERLLGGVSAGSPPVPGPVAAATAASILAPNAPVPGICGTGQSARPAVAALTKNMTDLVKQIEPAIAADPSRKAPLLKLATEAHTCLKAGDTAGASAGIAALRKALSLSEAQPVPRQAQRIGKGQADQVAQAAADKDNGEILPPAQPGAADGDGSLALAFKPRGGVEARVGDALPISDSHPKNGGKEERYEVRRALGEETPDEDIAHHHPIDPLHVGGTPFGIGLGAGSGAGRQGAGSGPPATAPALGAAGSQTPAVVRPAQTPALVPTPVPVSTPAPTPAPSPVPVPAPALTPTLVPVPSRTPVVPPYTSRPATTEPVLTAFMQKTYRSESAIGSGSTADAVRSELVTGLPTKGKFHIQKARESISFFQRWLSKNPGASANDRTVAQTVLDDLRNALAGE